MSAHLIIAAFFFIAFGCFSLFLLLFLKPDRTSEPRESDIRDAIAGLSPASIQDARLIFEDRDYRTLGARQELKAVCGKFRRDRRRIALLWLGELQKDVLLVWEFRRFLVRNGLPVTFREEAAIASGACFALFYLNAVRLTVFLCGPFFLSRALRGVKTPVQQLSTRGAGLLARAPVSIRLQLQQQWKQHVVSCGLA